MVTAREKEAGFTLTELMVVVVILSLLAAVSTPLFTRDSNARKGRDWAKIVAQALQRARFQSMGDRANIHVLLYRARIDAYRQETGGGFKLLSTTYGPVADDGSAPTVAIYDVRNDTTLPTEPNAILASTPAPPQNPSAANDIIFTPLGSTRDNANWRIYVRNELLPLGHPDASFLITVGGLTGYISANYKAPLQ